MDKMKENFSGVEQFARKYTVETLTAVAILVATLSSWGRFFIGSFGWAVVFVAVGAIIGIFFPTQIDHGIKRAHAFSIKEGRTGEILMEVIKIAIALFLPFLYFGFLGLMTGTSYHYYARFAQKK